MTYFDNNNMRTPVLVIEDDKNHLAAIIERFQGDHRFELTPFENFGDEWMLNYKATRPDSQIVIVDLELGKNAGRDGRSVIKELLWPADRTMLFIVFSQYLQKLPPQPPLEVTPYWTFVPKALGPNDELNTDCLDDLFSVVENYRDISTPPIETQRYNAHILIEQLEQYLRDESQLPPFRGNIEKFVRDPYVYSVDILNECSNGAMVFNRAGLSAANIGIGIYGSCGRLEARRKTSDIEFSTFYYGGPEPGSMKEVAVIFWNRMMMFMQHNRWKVEGMEEIRKRRPPILQEQFALEDLPNGYRPVISIDTLLAKNIDLEPQIRDRHLQILTELKPVFNPQLFLELKRDLIWKGTGAKLTHIADIVSSSYFSDLFTQFFIDTRPKTISTPKDVKRFCYRTLHLLCLRIFLIEQVHLERKMTSHEDWRSFFELLSDPGLVKIIQLTTWCRRNIPDNIGSKKNLLRCLREFVQSYIILLQRLWTLAGEDGPEQNSDWASYCLPHVKICIDRYVAVVKQMTAVFPTAKDIKWLVDTGPIIQFNDYLRS